MTESLGVFKDYAFIFQLHKVPVTIVETLSFNSDNFLAKFEIQQLRNITLTGISFFFPFVHLFSSNSP